MKILILVLGVAFLLFAGAAFLPAQQKSAAESQTVSPAQGKMTDKEYIDFLRAALNLQLARVSALSESMSLCSAQVDALRKPQEDQLNAQSKALNDVVSKALTARGLKGGPECVQLDGSIRCPEK